MPNETRARAFDDIKVAVRAYSREPTVDNAARVETAWQLVRTLDAVTAWRYRTPNLPERPSHQSP